MIVKELDTLKYSELQKLAKNAGIKANQKLEKLVKALKEHYIEDESSEAEKCCDEAGKSTPKASDVPVELAAAEGNGSNSKASRKRRRTFELDEPTLSAQNTPSSDNQPERKSTRQRNSSTKTTPEAGQEEPAKKRVRKNTYDKDSPLPADRNDSKAAYSGSPGTKAIIDSMDANSSSADRKAKLMSALNQKIQNKVHASSPQQNVTSQPSQIPRFMAFLANKQKTEPQKPLTPGNKNWTKIHNKEFSKFDSLDVYLEKKQQRMEKLTGSTKRPTAGKSPARQQPKIVKPVSKPQAQMKPFIPTVTSVKNISLNFSKTPANKTPSRPTQKSTANVSMNQTVAKTPKSTLSARKSVGTSRKSVGTSNRGTPFKFTGNTSGLNTTVTSQKKAFDLKASLAKPLTWKPHTGKLQPLDFNKPPAAGQSTKASVPAPKAQRPSRQAMATKTRPMQAKDVRRAKQLDRGNNQKYIDMMKKRGLMA